MTPDSHAKSFLSKSYVNAVATQAGFSCKFGDEADYGVDATISEIQVLRNGMHVETGFEFNVQIKASHDYKKYDGLITYDLDAAAYIRLTQHKGGLIVLVLFCLPKERAQRCVLTEDCLELRNCGYWYHITGEPTENKRTKTVHLPRKQIFDPDACVKLMQFVKNGDWKNGHINS